MCDIISDFDDDSDDESLGYDSDYSGCDCYPDFVSEFENEGDEFLDCIDEYPDVGRPVGRPPAADEPGLAKRPLEDLDLAAFSEIDSGESEDGDDEAEEEDDGMIKAIEAQLQSKKAIRKEIAGEKTDPWTSDKQDPWQQPRRPSLVCVLVCLGGRTFSLLSTCLLCVCCLFLLYSQAYLWSGT